jgi:hypothetical protein
MAARRPLPICRPASRSRLMHNTIGAAIVLMALTTIPIAETIEQLQTAGILQVLFHLD